LEVLEDRLVLSPVVFTLNPNNSQLTLSGTVNDGQAQQQGDGSLTTRYSGTISTDLADDLSTIRFLSDGTAINALVSGQWAPLPGGGDGTANANYGAQANNFHVQLGPFSVTVTNAQIGFRNVVLTTSSDNPLLLDGSSAPLYAFDAGSLRGNATAGSADYRAVIPDSTISGGPVDLSNQSAQNQATDPATVLDNGDGTFTLTVPVKITITTNISLATSHWEVTVMVTVNITGSLQATSAPAPVPPPPFTRGGGGGAAGPSALIRGNSAPHAVFATTTSGPADSCQGIEPIANNQTTLLVVAPDRPATIGDDSPVWPSAASTKVLASSTLAATRWGRAAAKLSFPADAETDRL
jgi:hypothetical protein